MYNATFFGSSTPPASKSLCGLYLGPAVGSHAEYFGFTLHVISTTPLYIPSPSLPTPFTLQKQKRTHVLYGLYAALVCVIFGRCSFTSHSLVPVFKIASVVGGWSTM